MTVKERMIMIAIGSLPFIMVVGNSMFIPILPNIENALLLDPTQTGWMLTAFAIPAAVTIPLIGFLSDRYGRKKLIIISLSVICVGSVISVIAAATPPNVFSYTFMLVGRAIQGFGAGGTSPLALTVIGDVFSGRKRSTALGAMEVSNGIGKMFSPFLGIIAVMMFWYSAFIFYFIMAFTALIVILFFIKIEEERTFTTFKAYKQTIKDAMKRSYHWLIPLFLTGGVVLFILFGLLFYLSYEAERIYGIVGWSKGVLFFIPLGFLTAASYVSGRFIGGNDTHMKKILYTAFILLFLSSIGGMVEHNFIALVLIMSSFSVGTGLLLPACNLLVTASVSKEERGMVVAIYSMVRFLGVALGPLVYSYWMIYEWDMFLKSTLVLLSMSAALYGGWLINEKKELYHELN